MCSSDLHPTLAFSSRVQKSVLYICVKSPRGTHGGAAEEAPLPCVSGGSGNGPHACIFSFFSVSSRHFGVSTGSTIRRWSGQFPVGIVRFLLLGDLLKLDPHP